MFASLLAIPILSLALIIQSAVSSRLPLLHGTTDLVMLILIAWSLQERVRSAWFWAAVAGLITAYISAMPPLVPVVGYLAIAGTARLLQGQIWKTPVLAMFGMAVMGTLIMHFLTVGFLSLSGVEYPLVDSLEIVTLPSILLNLLFALPVYTLIKDLAASLYPMKLDV